MNILLIGGSTAAHSKSEYLLEYIQQRFLNNPQISVKRINPSDFNPGHLINYDFQSTDVIDFQQAVYRADVIYISTPVYQAAYSGALKLLLEKRLTEQNTCSSGCWRLTCPSFSARLCAKTSFSESGRITDFALSFRHVERVHS